MEARLFVLRIFEIFPGGNWVCGADNGADVAMAAMIRKGARGRLGPCASTLGPGNRWVSITAIEATLSLISRRGIDEQEARVPRCQPACVVRHVDMAGMSTEQFDPCLSGYVISSRNHRDGGSQ
jgi:hypothetical protein